MRKIFAGLLSVCLLMASCKTDPPGDGQGQAEEGFVKAKGGRIYGGTFKLNESEYIKSMFPLNILDAYSYRVASQIYEGLFKFDQKSLKIKNGLAESYSLNEDGTEYTIKIRQGVKFHDDPCFSGGKGRELKADDVVYCFKRVCTKSKLNQSFHLFSGILKGADTYYTASSDPANFEKDLEGVQKVDDYTVKIVLEKPSSVFLYNLARPGAFIYPQEAFDKYQEDMRVKCVGTGPFKLDNVEDDISILLSKNDNYYGVDEYGNKLPFLQGISVQFLKDKKVELLEFKKGKLDMMYRLPTDHIIDILEDSETDSDGSYSQYDLQRAPEMSTQFLAFQNQKGVFKDINVRKAFSFAIDREKILEYVLNGEGYAPGTNGFTPPSFEDYDINKISGYSFNIDSARIYLAKAGYPNGKNFPKINLDFNPEGARHTNVAVEVQKQLNDHLNINIELSIAPHAQITEKSMVGNYDLLRLAWAADYPSPENFLWMFYGKNVPESLDEKSFPNILRYTNAKFDELYEKALNAKSNEEALVYFMKAEKIMMQDAPLLILWYDEGYRLLQSYIKNFPNNAMQYRDFSEVYIDKSNYKSKDANAASN